MGEESRVEKVWCCVKKMVLVVVVVVVVVVVGHWGESVHPWRLWTW